MRFASKPTLIPWMVPLLISAAVAAAQTSPWHEDFEQPQPTWQATACRVIEHRRIQQDAHAGVGCEWFQIEVEAGSHAYLASDVGRPRVIEELSPSVWVKSDRVGLSMVIRLVLPRTIDPRSGQPLVTTLPGPTYNDAGRWQQLKLSGIPKILTRQIHALRLQLGSQVDPREAYIDAIVLVVSGGQGPANIWIDDLEVEGYGVNHAGHVQVVPPAPPLGEKQVAWNSVEAVPLGPLAPVRLPPVESGSKERLQRLPETTTPDVAPPPRRKIKLACSILQIDGRPMFPRIIQHRGEPLAHLKQLGFNTVWLQRLPAPEVLEEASRLDLWLICPPPGELSAIAEISPAFDPVLAWDLGGDLTETELEATRRLAEQIHTADRRVDRPLVCRPREDFRGYSRAANLLLVDRRPIGTSLSMTEYSQWVRRQPLLARPGTPLWTTVQTQPNEALRRQIAAMEPGSSPPQVVSSEQMRLLAYTAVAAGSRGLLFLSDSPLDAPDPETQQRALALELLNIELGLIEPWAAAGSYVATADSNHSEVFGAILRAERTRLLLPIWLSPKSQYVAPQSATNMLSMVLPGIPEASNAYEITPGGLSPARHARVTGGMSVTLKEFGPVAEVLLAHDPSIVGAVQRRAVELGRRKAELERHLAVRKLNTVEAISSQLSARTPIAAATGWFESARRSLQACDGLLAAGDVSGAALNAQRAMSALRLIERAYWDAAVEKMVSPVSSPAAVGFDTLPLHWRLVDRIAGVRFGSTRIAGGDFEDLETMMRAGWNYVQHAPANLQTTADLAPDAARSGRLGLRLAAAPVDPKNSPVVIEAPPVLFTSPPVQLDAGQIICIHGWVNVPSPITSSNDGLLIVDSITGEALADRIVQTEGWRQFALYRATPQSGPICVTFALSGIGEARIDDVAIQVLESPDR